MITDKNFADWESNAFGFGYGTGEILTLTALHDFLKACPSQGNYNYTVIQEAVGHVPCWLLINLLCHQRMIKYGTSPRFGWLTEKGVMLKDYLITKGVADAYEFISSYDEYCYPDHCNCDGEPCKNPLWETK